MEQEIFDALDKYYKNLIIETEFISPRVFRIAVFQYNQQTGDGLEFIFTYDKHLTFDANIDNIKSKINTNLLRLFIKKEAR